MWGKEAGWAHSVLFTADLQVFSERLSTKLEVINVKQEADSAILAETQVKSEVLRSVKVKREFEEEKKPLIAVEDVAIKRRRKG